MFYFFTVHRKVKQNLKVTTASVKQGQRDELFPAGFTRNCTLICASPQRIRQNEQCKTSPKWWNYSWNSPSGVVCSVLSSPWVNGAGSEVRREGEWTVTVLRRLSVLKWSELDWNFRIWAWPARARARVCMCVCVCGSGSGSGGGFSLNRSVKGFARRGRWKRRQKHHCRQGLVKHVPVQVNGGPGEHVFRRPDKLKSHFREIKHKHKQTDGRSKFHYNEIWKSAVLKVWLVSCWCTANCVLGCNVGFYL